MEKAHDISLDEPCVAHQAILFMLDVLMRNNKPTMPLAELYDSFGDKSFTPQMLRAVGGNEQGLKQFLLRYPSLFTVNGDLISANSGGNQLPRTSTTPERYLRKTKSNGKTNSGSESGIETASTSTDLVNSSSSSSSSSSTSSAAQNGTVVAEHDSKTMKEIEQEAIAFFRKQMTKREEDWLPIVSVAGHASQSSSDVRKYVGPQNEFKAFLMKYPHIFFVREEYCGLKGRADLSAAPFPPPSPPPKRRVPVTTSVLTRNHSFKSTNRYSACGNMMPNATAGLSMGGQSMIAPIGLSSMAAANLNPTSLSSVQSAAQANSGKPRLTPVEVKAVHYVMRILHKNGRMLLQTIPGLISRAPDQVSNIVGFTREDLIQFFKRHSAIFQLHPDGCVSVKQDAVKALILKDGSSVAASSPSVPGAEGNVAGIITGNGVVLRIFPKYGILNMDNNEQVFFDIQSCQFETFSDLTTILHTGDRLHFNAVIGPRDGSTKWRSIKTWIKMKPQQSTSNNMICMLDNMSSHSDADKSDDSSSSSHGGANGYPRHGGLHHNAHISNQINNSNGFMNPAHMYQNPVGQNSVGHFYPSQHGQPIPGLPSSPNGLNSNIIAGNMHQSNSNLSIDENSLNGGSGTLSNSASNNNVVGGASGDFNQYQLDSGDLTQTTNGNLSADEGSHDSTATSPLPNLVHSSSANNLQLLQNSSSSINNVQIISSTNSSQKPSAISTSKSIHSFSLSSPSPTNDQSIEQKFSQLQMKKQLDDKNQSTLSNPNTVTKFMKESQDKISKREINPDNDKMVSIGCQTISTGDITVTNVYIE